MRKLSKFELNALNSLNKIEIRENNNAELGRLRKQRHLDKVTIRIVISVMALLCLSISGYEYYRVSNKKTQAEIQQIRPSTPSRHPYQGHSTITTKRRQDTTSYRINTKVQQNKNGKIYYWTDKKGTIHATNTDIPKAGEPVNVLNEVNTFNRRTPVTITNNNVYIPVTIHNNGTTVTVEMLLDTGCSTTVINTRLARKLKLKKLYNTKSTVADGRIVDGASAKINYIKVGPYSEQNVEIVYQKHAGSANKGLLGMDFLKKHPFTIDFKNKAVIWE